jgi:outer membrane protein assembly factor BamB
MSNAASQPIAPLWSTRFEWFFSAQHAPILAGDCLFARCGQSIVCLDASSGAIRWETLLDERAGDGSFLLEHRGRLVTEIYRQPERLSSIVAVTPDGSLAWRTDLNAIVAHDNAAIAHDELIVLGAEPDRGRMMYAINSADGRVRAEHKLHWGGNALLAWKDGFLVRNQSPRREQPGLYRIGRDARGGEAIESDSVWVLSRRDALILVVARRAPSLPRSVEIRDADTLDVRWSVEALNEAAALDGGSVYHIAGGAPHGMLVSRSAVTGSELWRAPPLPGAASRIDVAGGVVFVRLIASSLLYDVEDGRLIGELQGAYGPPAAGDDGLFIGGRQAVSCFDLTRARA